MRRPLVWLPGVVLLAAAVAVAALHLPGAGPEPAVGRTAPTVVFRSASASGGIHSPAAAESGAPEVVVVGDLAPVGRRSAPRPAAARPARVVHEIVYVDAPATPHVDQPREAPQAPAREELEASSPEVATAVEAPAPAAVAPPSAPASSPPGTSRAGAMVTGAAIGAGLGAVLGGGRGALRGAIGGAAGGALGGRSGAVLGGVLGGIGGRGGGLPRDRCPNGSVRDYSTLTL